MYAAVDNEYKTQLREILNKYPTERIDTNIPSHPHDDTNCLSEYLLTYMCKLMVIGNSKILEIDDLTLPPEILQLDNVHDVFLNNCVENVSNKNSCGNNEFCFTFNVFKTIINMNKWCIIKTTTVGIMDSLLPICGVFAFRELINFLYDDTQELYYGIIYAVLIAFTGQLSYLCTARCWVYCERAGIATRNLLMSLLFRKSLMIPTYVMDNDETSIGSIVNIMTNDTERIYMMIKDGITVIPSCLNILICLLFMIYIIGIESLIGVFIMILLVPINIFIGKILTKRKDKALIFTDERVNFLSEMLNGIRIIKYYSWEIPLKRVINNIRKKEINAFKSVYKWRSLLSTFINYIPHITIAAIIIIQILLHKPINVVEIYLLISFINATRRSVEFIGNIDFIINGVIAIHRIQTFFNLDDHTITINEEEKTENDILIKISNASFQHSPDSNSNMLRNINLEIRKKELIAVIGSVGSGKTTLCKSLLGETHFVNNPLSSFNNQLNTAFVGQQYFLMNGTIRKNIIMDFEFDINIYNKVLDAAALIHDLQLLPGGDQTEIGENGINLSGGQKSRICISRLLYRNIYSESIDLLLFDDPLSALDNDVTKQVFNKGIINLCSNTARIVVLNSHLELLDYFDRIIVMEYNENENYCKIVENCDCTCPKGKQNLIDLKNKYQALLTQLIEKQDKNNGLSSFKQNNVLQKNVTEIDTAPAETLIKLEENINIEIIQKNKVKNNGSLKNIAKLTVDEDRVRGAVSSHLLLKYLDAASSGHGILLFIGMIMFYSLTQSVLVFFDLWISWLAATNDTSSPTQTKWYGNILVHYEINNYIWMYICCILICLILMVGFIRSLLLFSVCLSSSVTFEHDILTRVLNAPISVFDSTPIGRITNRFSRDLTIIDIEMPQTLDIISTRIAWFVSYIIVLCMIIPWYGLVLIPSFVILIKLRSLYISSTRELKRMDGITRSPIYSIFNECIFGLELIRSHQLEYFFIKKIEKQIILNTQCFFDFKMINRFFGVLLESIIMIQTFFISIFVIFLRDEIPPNIAALCISYAVSFGGAFQYFIRLTAQLETQLTAAERLDALSNTKQEANHYNAAFKSKHNDLITSTWPNNGEIHINNLRLKYRNDLPLVLKGINCEIAAGSKIGICGRTGAGKSSIIVSLFRIFEPESNSSIQIDNIEILKDMGLQDLRSKLAIIPQQPTLFSGTLRFNLDPFNKYCDDEIIQSLQNVYLWNFFKNKGIHYKITQNGSNLSLGQKQLICIARALLKKPKVLLCDEATSCVDFESDQLIQKSIRKNFSEDCTILTIAHRLETIIDSDKILVLENGKITQFDTPKNLLNDKNGSFYSLWHKLL
eukprot:29449_1